MSPKPYTASKSPITDPAALLQYSEHHVVYEVDLFFRAILVRNSKASVFPEHAAYFFSMARVECFVLHLRNLIGFMYPDRYHSEPDDILAHHFVSDADPFEIWQRARPLLSSTLGHAKSRADKEIVHLTAKRMADVRPEKEWDFVALGDEIRTALRSLIKVADVNLLDSGVSRSIPTGSL